MPKCPNCGKDIHYLNISEVWEVYEYGYAEVDENGELFWEWENTEYENKIGETVYACPECGYEIAEDEEEAGEFLSRRYTKEELVSLMREIDDRKKKVRKEIDRYRMELIHELQTLKHCNDMWLHLTQGYDGCPVIELCEKCSKRTDCEFYVSYTEENRDGEKQTKHQTLTNLWVKIKDANRKFEELNKQLDKYRELYKKMVRN